MNNISNRTLVYLLVIAIVVSLTGTLISLSKLGELSVTGFSTGANSTGEVSVTINSSCSVTMSGSNINFSSGIVNGSECELNTSNGFVGNGCNGFASVSNGLNFTNNGNEYINLSIVGNETAAEFLGGDSPTFKINPNAIQAGVCAGGNFALDNWTDLTTTAAVLCNNSNKLSPSTNNDTLEIDVYLSIPSSSNESGSIKIKLIGICPA